MTSVKGYILPLSNERWLTFCDNTKFGEPVPEFTYSRNLPLICFIFSQGEHGNRLTHVCLARRGLRAGTERRRLNCYDAFQLPSPIREMSLVNELNSHFKAGVSRKVKASGGLVSDRCNDELIRAVVALSPSAAGVLNRYREERYNRISRLGEETKAALAEQKEAVATAMNIAGISRDEMRGWDVPDTKQHMSFLSGLESARMREDQMVVNDLNNLPGFSAIQHTAHDSVVFENDESRLTVVLANRLPLEKQLGVDLIYYNELFRSFILIQYKAMEGEEDRNAIFRFPNAQLDEEIERMEQMLKTLSEIKSNEEADGFRLTENPFFLKICPRITFNPDNIGLVKGMYLPLDYWKKISCHPTMIGPNGGKRISYQNVRRYFDNTDFVRIAANGWIGTSQSQSTYLEELIRAIIENGRTVVLAVNLPKDRSHRRADTE